MATRRRPFGQVTVAVRAMLAATVLLGVLYPLVMTGAAQVLFPGNANGSMVQLDGRDVGSGLIGQAYTRDTGQKDADGNAVMAPDPRWFQSRPSAVGYDGAGSGASQYGPNSPELLKLVEQRRADVAKLEGVDPAQVPPDAVTASGSGLDPHISPEYAVIQVRRVAQQRGLSVDEVQRLVRQNTTGRKLGFLGEPTVNVVTLNRDLAELN
ncbi:potassium-transporting ATPase, C subunit [Kribbella flavida DSM 17836]|uniref:Potassium-transporting ATPase KdpC subunit n=1 Tax=Kribbella flavida (strain DSM 17836 / JCM 10339 / NBRC 14399) TaxID=479435 RepID=D2Q287_KRIFD|nr:K(+)-transporting ATPase subunit C [Kribbella flavida]ADB35783.1 potassium-transporting ATPase, C subunit [Kribbella flavida DSM 17836]